MLESYYEMESTWLFELHTTFQQFVLVAFVVDSDTRRWLVNAFSDAGNSKNNSIFRQMGTFSPLFEYLVNLENVNHSSSLNTIGGAGL